VVTSGSPMLADGITVKVVEQAAPAPTSSGAVRD